jgi:hypothetical protein
MFFSPPFINFLVFEIDRKHLKQNNSRNLRSIIILIYNKIHIMWMRIFFQRTNYMECTIQAEKLEDMMSTSPNRFEITVAICRKYARKLFMYMVENQFSTHRDRLSDWQPNRKNKFA